MPRRFASALKAESCPPMETPFAAPCWAVASLHFRFLTLLDGWIGLKTSENEGPERTRRSLDFGHHVATPLEMGNAHLSVEDFAGDRPAAQLLPPPCCDLGLVATSFSDSAESFDAL
jgi:hypothetical protein